MQENLKEALEKEPEKRVEDEKYVKILGNDALQKKIVEYGDAESGRPTNGQMVTVTYEAYLKENRDKLVDHSENYSFILGDGDVIPAVDMVVSLMDKNEKCEMICESRLGFGDLGKQPDIPPKSDFFYKIHLVDFKDLKSEQLRQALENLVHASKSQSSQPKDAESEMGFISNMFLSSHKRFQQLKQQSLAQQEKQQTEENRLNRSQILYTDKHDLKLDKSNILMLGPTGSGKTLLAQTVAMS